MKKKKNNDDGIYLDDSEMNELMNLRTQRSIYEAEMRAKSAETEARAAQARAMAAERDRQIAMSYAYQAQTQARAAEQGRQIATFNAIRAQRTAIINQNQNIIASRNKQLLEVHGMQMIQQQNLQRANLIANLKRRF